MKYLYSVRDAKYVTIEEAERMAHDGADVVCWAEGLVWIYKEREMKNENT